MLLSVALLVFLRVSPSFMDAYWAWSKGIIPVEVFPTFPALALLLLCTFQDIL